MNIHRVEAVVFRHLYHFRRNWDRLSDCVYWPIMDLLVWGLTTKWLQTQPQAASNVLLIMLTGIVFWQIVWRANCEISLNLLEEAWCSNMTNLFATPLKISEWIAGVMGVGLIKVALSMVVGFGASWILYSMDVFALGYHLLPFLVSLILFGWSLGFLASGLIVRYGRNIQTVAWMMGFVFAPFSAVYYPVSVLPEWAQYVAYALPATYVFEGMRTVLNTGTLSIQALVTSFLLNLVYLAASIAYFCQMFEKRRVLGIQKLD